MTEPKRWTPSEVYHHAVNSDRFVAAADFDRLRDERDRLAEALLTMLREAAIIAGSHEKDRPGWTAGAVEKQAAFIPHLAAAGRLILAEANAPMSVGVAAILDALAVFDTLTEEKT